MFHFTGNSQADCNPTEQTRIQRYEFSGYTEFTWVFFISVIGFALVVCALSFSYDKFKRRSDPVASSLARRQSMKKRATKYALDKIGQESVYRFFLGKSWVGWMVASAVMAIQIWILFTFVRGAEFDLSDDNSDFVYTWKCPRDNLECDDKADLTAAGWVMFGILMASHLLKDLVNGSKMIVLCAKEGYQLNSRIRFFVGGLFLSTVTTFTLFASTIYNKAIATSNTEVIANAVIILFITDLDEQFFSLIEAADERLITWLSGKDLVVTEKVDDVPDDIGVISAFQSTSLPQSSSSFGFKPKTNMEMAVKDEIEKKMEIFWEEVRMILNQNHQEEEKGSD